MLLIHCSPDCTHTCWCGVVAKLEWSALGMEIMGHRGRTVVCSDTLMLKTAKLSTWAIKHKEGYRSFKNTFKQ